MKVKLESLFIYPTIMIQLLSDKQSKLGVDSSSLTPLEVRMAAAKKARESSAREKGSSATLAADSKVDKSSPAGDVGVSDILKTNFLSSLSACVKLVDHVYQAGDLNTFSSLSLEKQREATFSSASKKRWWQMSRIRKVELLRAWLIRRMRKRLQIRDLLLACRTYVRRRVDESDPFDLCLKTC
ncbi:unnamed protein product [Prunus armeniaca]